MEIINNTEESRFEVTVDGHLSIMNYILKDESIALTHTSVPSSLRGRGVAAELAKEAFAYAEKNHLKIIPICTYISTFVTRYPEYRKFL